MSLSLLPPSATASLEAREADYLRRRLLPLFMLATALLGWGWLGYVLMTQRPLTGNILPTLALCLAAVLTLRVRQRHHRLACWLLLAAMMLSVGVLSFLFPQSLAVMSGALVFIATQALLGTWASALSLPLTLAAALWGLHLAGGPALLADRGAQVAVLYGLSWLATWMAGWPLNTSLQWALTGWDQAREALAQVQERRGELYRTVRALEEATRRIDHTNQELIAAQREAELARNQKARFAAMVSHELRGPLNMILGFSRMMVLSPEQYGQPLPAVYYADVDAIYRNTQHLAALVDDILDLSQIEANRLPLVKDRVELAQDVVQRAMSIVRPLAERKGLHLHVELADDLPWVLADPVRLRQVMLNLLSNAVRETERGSITISSETTEDALLVHVSDTGPGIAACDVPKLFTEFQQLQPKGKTGDVGGSGLGLNISKQFIELHGGAIWVESQPGKGTTFSFSLPLPGLGGYASGGLRTRTLTPRQGLHEVCLVLHRDPHLVRALGRYIDGYRLVGVAGPEHLGSLVEELHPQAIIIDPSQVEPISQLVADTGYDVPLITCQLPRSSYEVRYDNVIGYLTKPLNPDVVLAVIKGVEREEETTVLLVDDDPDAVRLMERVLTSLPRRYRVLRAYDGQRALEVLADTEPDILFLDLYMPVMSGEELLARLQQDARLCRLPTVIVSAHDAIEGQMTVETPIALRAMQPLELSCGARCLKALLDAAQPRYLPAAKTPAPSATGSPG